MERVAAGELDAFFLIAGHPAAVVQWAAEQAPIRLVPVTGRHAAILVELNPFLRQDTIPADTYAGVGETLTLSVAAQWVTREDVSAATIYGILHALWRSEARSLLDRGHVKGRSIRLETALEGLGI